MAQHKTDYFIPVQLPFNPPYLMLLQTLEQSILAHKLLVKATNFTSKITSFISNWDFSQDILHNTRGFQQDLKFKEKLQIVEFHSLLWMEGILPKV